MTITYTHTHYSLPLRYTVCHVTFTPKVNSCPNTAELWKPVAAKFVAGRSSPLSGASLGIQLYLTRSG